MEYDLSKYDFLDLGSKKGGSIQYCQKRFSAKGIGIDINEDHVKVGLAAGYDMIKQDILKLDIDHKFKFVSALDFLEHLPNIEAAERIVKKMSELASDYLFIRHPSFDDIEYLESNELKITWTDWEGHTAMMRAYDYANMFRKLGLNQYCFLYRKDLVDSSNEFVVPLKAPVNTLKYSKDLGPKKRLKFSKKVYSQIDIFVALKPIDFDTWNRITSGS